jgi:hypothetical protein
MQYVVRPYFGSSRAGLIGRDSRQIVSISAHPNAFLDAPVGDAEHEVSARLMPPSITARGYDADDASKIVVRGVAALTVASGVLLLVRALSRPQRTPRRRRPRAHR